MVCSDPLIAALEVAGDFSERHLYFLRTRTRQFPRQACGISTCDHHDASALVGDVDAAVFANGAGERLIAETLRAHLRVP